MGVAVVMDRPQGPVVPGSESVADVRVRNTGAVVDQFDLDVVGEIADWAHVSPAQVNLLPGEESTARIVFTPPRSSRVPEGPVPFALRVMSREDTDGSSIQEAVVDVAPYSQTVGELLPRTSTGRRSAQHQLALDNLGNHPQLVHVAATDPDLKLDFRIEPANVTLAPGTATFVRIRVKPRRTFWRGSNVSLPFQVTATPAEGEAIVLPGTMLQTSLLPSWIFRALALAAVVAVALVALWFALLKPAVESTAEEVAQDNTEELADAIQKASADAAQAEAAAQEAEEKAEDAATGGSGSEGAPGPGEDEAGGPGGDGGPKTKQVAATTEDPLDFRITTEVPTAGGFRDATFTPAPRSTVLVSDIVLQNPAGDSGTLRVQRGDDALLVFGLENFRDLDYHFIQPARFSEEAPVVVSVDCRNTDGACTPSVYFSGTSITPKRR
jgi:hypothetical protein